MNIFGMLREHSECTVMLDLTDHKTPIYQQLSLLIPNSPNAHYFVSLALSSGQMDIQPNQMDCSF